MGPGHLVLKAGEGAQLAPSLESTDGCWCGQPGEPSEVGFSKELDFVLLD